jgi:hypothetical protein
VGLGDKSEILNEFDSKLLTLQKNMQHEVIKVIRPLFLFLKTFDPHSVHNMFAIMLDPCFKSIQIVENYVGLGATICLAFEYDTETRIPLLMACLRGYLSLHLHGQIFCLSAGAMKTSL